MYRVTGKIDRWDDIPWDVPIIISGGINGSDAWFWRMPGVFKKDNDRSRFVDDFGMSTPLLKGGRIGLNILEKCTLPRP